MHIGFEYLRYVQLISINDAAGKHLRHMDANELLRCAHAIPIGNAANKHLCSEQAIHIDDVTTEYLCCEIPIFIKDAAMWHLCYSINGAAWKHLRNMDANEFLRYTHAIHIYR